jgi:hypothetical protein
MENKYTQMNNHKNEEEIDYTQLIDEGRKYANAEQLKEGEYNLSMALAISDIDTGSYYQALAILSFIFIKNKNLKQMLPLITKYFNKSKINKLNSHEGNTVYCMIKILYRTASILAEHELYFTSAFLYFEAKSLFEHNDLRSDKENFDTLDKAFGLVLNKIGEKVKLNL